MYVYYMYVLSLIPPLLLPKLRELRERLEEVESSGSRRMKAQLHAMDSKLASLEEELDASQKYVIQAMISHQECTTLNVHVYVWNITGNCLRTKSNLWIVYDFDSSKTSSLDSSMTYAIVGSIVSVYTLLYSTTGHVNLLLFDSQPSLNRTCI